MSNMLGYPKSNNDTLAMTNETMVASMTMMLAAAANPEELMPAILNWYPDLNTEDRDTRESAATEMMTDWWYGTGSSWEATTRAR